MRSFSGNRSARLARRVLTTVVLLAAIVSVVAACGSGAGAPSGVRAERVGLSHLHAQAAYGRLPLSFERNRGQAPARFEYVARTPGSALGLGRSGVELVLAHGRKRGSVLQVSPVGGRLNQPVGEQRLAGRVSYFVGSDRSSWTRGAPTFARVVYRDVWPGVDLAFHGREGTLEFDVDLAPGADPGKLALRFAGVRLVRPDGHGGAVITITGGTIRVPAPHAAQGNHRVSSRLVMSGDTVRIALGSYKRTRALLIDPQLLYSTYVGGSGPDSGSGIAVGASGDAFITGTTSSTDFPTTPGAYQAALGGTSDVFVTKLNADGTAVIYSTYLGGSSGAGSSGIAVDASGDAYVAGSTSSPDFPTTSGAYQTSPGGGSDVFVTKLAPDGRSLVYSTFLGGSGDDSNSGIAVDSHGAAAITGGTQSGDFPTTPGAYQAVPQGNEDAFVSLLAADGKSLVYSTYLGGASNEVGDAIAVDSTGTAYITGRTQSGNFPTTPGAYQTNNNGGTYGDDAFVTKLASNGRQLIYSTYLGGAQEDYANGIAVDSTGAAYVTGETAIMNIPTPPPPFPTTPAAFQPKPPAPWQNCFVSKLTPDGNSLVYSTYLGGSVGNIGTAIAVDSIGAAYVTGLTISSDFPTTPGAFQPSLKGGNDVFFSKLAPNGATLAYSTYIGGSGVEASPRVAVDPSGAAYVGGTTSSNDLPTTAGARQTSHTGTGSDAFVSTFTFAPSATTGSAANVLAVSATLNGTVNPQTNSTIYYFEYGTSVAYGSRVPATDATAGSDSSDHPESAMISSLQPATTYHFRIVATSSAGTGYGDDRTFSTQALPPPPTKAPTATTNTAGAVSTGGAVLSGTVNPQGQASAYHFEYGTSKAYVSRVPATDSTVGSDGVDHAVSQAVSGLAPGTLYHFRVVATNATGASYGADQTFRTQALPPAVVGVPGMVGTLGASLKFTFACRGSSGQTCQGQATAMAIEKLSADGKTLTGVLTSKPRSGRYRVVMILLRSVSASAGQSKGVSIALNSTGQMLRNNFNNVPADVTITATAGGKTTTIRTAKVTFGPNPPKTSLATAPTTKAAKARFDLRCKGKTGQLSRGSAKLTTYEKLAADGKTITGLSSGPLGNRKLVTLANSGWSVRAGGTITVSVQLSATGQNLLKKFGQVPATLTITPTYNGYDLGPFTARITFKR